MFSFELQSVLDVRQVLEEKALVAYSEERKRLAREEEALASLLCKRTALAGELKDRGDRLMCASEVSMLGSYMEALKACIETQEKVVRQVVLVLEGKRAELVEALRNRKTMERLRDKKWDEFRCDMDSRERKDLDEMSALRFARKQT